MTSFQKIAKINLVICGVIVLAAGCERAAVPADQAFDAPSRTGIAGGEPANPETHATPETHSVPETDATPEAHAASETHGEASQAGGILEVTQGWLRATSGPVTAGYLVMTNISPSDDRLIAVRSAISDQVEIHDILEEDGVKKMRPQAAFDIPGGQTRALAPGGAHLMFFGLREPLEVGEEHEMTLTFEEAGDIALSVEVRDSPPVQTPHAH